MDPAAELARLGGCATAAQLRPFATGHARKRAVRRGEIVRLSRGRYALPMVETHRREAHRLAATLSHLSAAMTYRWPVKSPPDQPWITVRRKRNLNAVDRSGVHVVWRDLAADDVQEA